MAIGDYGRKVDGGIYDKLDHFKKQLESCRADMRRLEAAIAFLESNPGAQALVNSL